MSVYNRYIHKFMQAKAEKLADVLGISKELYYNKADQDYILNKLPDKLAERIWMQLRAYIRAYNAEGLEGRVCPACIGQTWLDEGGDCSCSACWYARHHGGARCENENSDFKKIFDAIYESGRTAWEILPNSFYRELIEKIEGEGNES